jgi:hypothetical protein
LGLSEVDIVVNHTSGFHRAGQQSLV